MSIFCGECKREALADKWLWKLILRISTDCAQTALEDPIKYGDGWVLHSQPVLQDIAEAAKMAEKALREARAAIQPQQEGEGHAKANPAKTS